MYHSTGLYGNYSEYEQLCKICTFYFRHSDDDGYRFLFNEGKKKYDDYEIYLFSFTVKTVEMFSPTQP